MSSATPLVIEAAINGSTAKAANPHVPRSVDEIVATALACVDAGASIVHNHNDEPNWGEPSTHSPDPYENAWRRIWQVHPGLLMHPTTSGERSVGIEERFSHIDELHRRGALTMSTADAGCIAVAFDSPDGPRALPTFGNSASDVDYIFRWCREADLPVHVSIFEPGMLRLTLAHHRAGSLPRRTKVQLYFGGPAALVGLPPTPASLDLYVAMLNGAGLPWMVGVLWGDILGSGLAEAALKAGGHVRVGARGLRGPRTPDQRGTRRACRSTRHPARTQGHRN
ncbi:MAG: 3-keto-5-aminohexanoate cleavage protein [Nocardiaceae bacterium]|nr:3-keto-5-aminohexanoate cleavage protein [Nocardiaceae bacterium]